jgi:hypothetical protein
VNSTRLRGLNRAKIITVAGLTGRQSTPSATTSRLKLPDQSLNSPAQSAALWISGSNYGEVGFASSAWPTILSDQCRHRSCLWHSHRRTGATPCHVCQWLHG